MIINNSFENVWKKVVVTYPQVLPVNLSAGDWVKTQ
jgi:hypothetical protein